MSGGPLYQQPGEASSLGSVMRFIQQSIGMDMENCLPAIVVSYNRKKNTAKVRPLIVTTTRPLKGGKLNKTPRVEYPEVPVLSIGGGGFHINFPLKKGDLGWIEACDRDITLFLQSLTEQAAGRDGPSHNFSDSRFIPDVYRQYVIHAEDTEAMVIQSTDGATRISVRADNIKITTPIKVVLDTPLVETTNNLKVGGNVEIVGDTLLKKNLKVDGPSCSLPQGTTTGGATVYGHTHNGAVPGFQ